jgi:hypothetical protein
MLVYLGRQHRRDGDSAAESENGGSQVLGEVVEDIAEPLAAH